MIAIIISLISLIISVLAYFKKPKEVALEDVWDQLPNWEYTEDGINFYDKTGKKILLKAEE